MNSRVYYKGVDENIIQVTLYRPYANNPSTGYTFDGCSTIFSTVAEAKEAYDAVHCRAG